MTASSHIQRLGRAAAALALTLLAGAGALMLVPALLGYERYVIEGASMTGSIPKGSIAYERPVPLGELGVGDVITYTPPGSTRRVTHRIVRIERGRDGRRRFETKGDYNTSRDPWRFTLSAATQPVVRFHVPLAGYALAALSIRAVRIVAIGLPALAVALSCCAGIRRREALA